MDLIINIETDKLIAKLQMPYPRVATCYAGFILITLVAS